VLIAFGVLLLPLIQGLLVYAAPFSDEETLLPAALTCLGGVVLAIVLHRIARRLFPGFGNWAWLAALILGLASIALGNAIQ
jgi:hypothetical protein